MKVLDAEIRFRVYCRNQRCRMKLPEPRDNDHAAFCTKGCYEQHYRHRCVVCENPIERKVENKLICRRPRCRTELRNWPEKYRPFHRRLTLPVGYMPSASSTPSEVPISCGFRSATRGIEWAISANSCPVRAPRHVIDIEFRCVSLVGAMRRDCQPSNTVAGGSWRLMDSHQSCPSHSGEGSLRDQDMTRLPLEPERRERARLRHCSMRRGDAYGDDD